MLEFVDYSWNTLIEYKEMIRKSPYYCNDISLGSILMWNHGVNMQFAVYHNTLIIKQNFGEDVVFSYPFGYDVEGALEALRAYVKEQDIALMFYGISEELLDEMKENPQFRRIHANYDRRWSDYLYDYQEMLHFSGRKFSGQRNHINKFRKNYGEPDFRELKQEDLPAIHKMLAEYHEAHGKGGIEEEEFQGTLELLEHYQELGMYGGALYVNDQVVGVTIGEVIGQMLIIHVEKGLTRYEGVYPTIFQSFMQLMEQKADIQFVNREDDAGDLGLRTSKLQYKPIQLLHKYVVTVDSPVVQPENIKIVPFDGGALTAIREQDKANYFSLCTDRDNNRYWGYDYEEDRNIIEVNEDVFFDSQAYDTSLGASMNFAVREKQDGELIGETIIYHFTANGHAEIGGRISKKAQGKGLGTKAFSATADYAEKKLHVKTRARCYKENIPSHRMIMASGFHQICEDDTFYYFER